MFDKARSIINSINIRDVKSSFVYNVGGEAGAVFFCILFVVFLLYVFKKTDPWDNR